MPQTPPPYERAGFANERAYRAARKKSQQWSDRHSRSENSRYSRTMTPETFRAYFDAYVSDATGVAARRKRGRHLGPSSYVKKYLVNVIRAYEPMDYDERYLLV